MTDGLRTLSTNVDSEYAPLFSIIVPVYNMSEHLEACIQSLIDQDQKDLEIIAIDDGSTDNSLQLLTAISQTDTRIQILSKENGGQGSARNSGLKKARGHYVLFVDSDDTVATNLLSHVTPYCLDPDTDVVSFGIEFRDKSGKSIAKRAPKNEFVSTGEAIFLDAMLDRHFLTSACNKVYRRSLLTRYQIFFPELRAYEDSVFSRNVALYSRKVVYLEKFLYFALVRDGSTSRGMTVTSFVRAAEMVSLERKMFQADSSSPEIGLAFRAHIARFFAHLLILAAFRMESEEDRSACLKIANEAGFFECANDRRAMSLLNSRAKMQVLLCRNLFALRIMARIARSLNITPY